MKNKSRKDKKEKICARCGHTKGEDDGGCSAWGDSWKRHLYVPNKIEQIKSLEEIIDNNELDIFAMEDVDEKLMRRIRLVDKINEIIDKLNNL